MNSFKTFWYSFKKSITSPSYYHDVVKAPFVFSLKYFVILIYVTILVQTLLIAIQGAVLLPKLPSALDTIHTRVERFYPADLIITVKKGVLSINKKEPYYIDVPELTESGEFEHAITINTKANVEQFPDYKTVLLVTDKEVVYPDKEGVTQYKVSQIGSKTDTFTFDHAKYLKLIANLNPIFTSLPTWAPFLIILAVIFLPLVGTVFTVLWNLVVIAILSLVSWGIASAFKVHLGYKKIFQLGMHAVTVPIILTLLLQFAGLSSPLLYTAAFLFWMVVILSQYKEVKA